MNCEAFEAHVLDVLYASDADVGAAREHLDGCARCAALTEGLRRARSVAKVPELAVPGDLEEKILLDFEATRRVVAEPWWGWRLVSKLGAYAMRPQAAMGALALLTVGMSLLLLRAKPAGPGSIRITENGVPAADDGDRFVAAPAVPPTAIEARRLVTDVAPRRDEERAAAARSGDVVVRPSEREASTTAAGEGASGGGPVVAVTKPEATTGHGGASGAAGVPPIDAAYATAMEDFKARRYGDAARGFDIVARGEGANAAMAALHAARATRYSSGCGAALAKYDDVAARHVGTSVGAEATWEAAGCYREVGQVARARQLYAAMRRVAGYRDRAEKELAALDQRGETSKP